MYCNTPDLQLQHGNSGMACGVRRTPLRVTHVHASLTVTNTPLRAGERWRFNFHSALATPHTAQRSAVSGQRRPQQPGHASTIHEHQHAGHRLLFFVSHASFGERRS